MPNPLRGGAFVSLDVSEDDHRLAEDLAAAAGALLVDARAALVAQGAPAAVLRAEGDRVSQELLAERLAQERPGDAVLSEEARDDLRRLDSPRVWIVDPLDGTREFSEPERSDWAVHVALALDGRPAAGAVALPAQDMTLSTLHAVGGSGRPDALLRARGDEPVAEHRVTSAEGPGRQGRKPDRDASARRGASTPADRREEPLRLVVSRSRPPAAAAAVADALDAELIEMGSAGAKAMAVVLGQADVYVHAGGQYEWDSCAPVAVAASAGFAVSRIDGSELRYNQRDPYLPDLVICRPELHRAVLAAAADA